MVAEHIVAFLRHIPQSNQDAITLESIVAEGNPDTLYGYALMLQTIGIVQIDSQRRIKAQSQTAKYMLTSLASYVENDLRWIDDWKTRGVHREATGVLQNGASLLHELETRRMNLLETPSPSRVEEVVQVLIKRTNSETGEAEFLMQYDANADQYQFIGGRRSPHDATLQDAVVREIDEEIANTLTFGDDYQLDLILPDMVVAATLSPTFGALTEYHFTVYHMRNLTQEIDLQADDAWVSVNQVIIGKVEVDNQIVTANDASLYQQINAEIKGGLVNLADSFSNSL